MKKNAAVFALVLFNGLLAAPVAHASTVYSVSAVPLVSGTIAMIPKAINDRNDIVGLAYLPSLDSVAYAFVDGNAALIPTLGGNRSSATGINNAGAVVGWSTTANPGEYRPFLVQAGKSPVDLGTLEGSMSFATGINNSGIISGYSSLGLPYSTGNAAFTTSAGAPLSQIDFGRLGNGTAYANAINDAGAVTGTVLFDPSVGFQAFIHDGDSTRLLPTLGGHNGQAMGINDRGEVVGVSALANGDGHAFFSDGIHVLDLGTLTGPSILGFGLGTPADSGAYGINNARTIVGSAGYSGYQGHGFVYADGHMSDINNLLASSDAATWVVTDAMAINDSGVIAAYGYQTGIYSGTTLLLTPHDVPEPWSAALLIIGIFGMAAARRCAGRPTHGHSA